MYQIHKEKEVEKAMQQIRDSLGTEGRSLSDADIRLLERLLAEAWAGFGKPVWEKVPFGQMRREDVDRILDFGRFLDLDKIPKAEVLDGLLTVLENHR